MVSELAFLLLVIAVAGQRLVELRISRRHEAALRARGATEHAPRQMLPMTLLHSAWLVAAPVEVWLLDRPLLPWLAIIAFIVFMTGQALRLAAMRALGPRWTVKIITVAEEPVAGGIFRYLRHPNYLGVVLEIAALPLIHGAWLTATIASVLNGLLLWRRIKAEERALASTSDYEARFAERRRFIPHSRAP